MLRVRFPPVTGNIGGVDTGGLGDFKSNLKKLMGEGEEVLKESRVHNNNIQFPKSFSLIPKPHLQPKVSSVTLTPSPLTSA